MIVWWSSVAQLVGVVLLAAGLWVLAGPWWAVLLVGGMLLVGGTLAEMSPPRRSGER